MLLLTDRSGRIAFQERDDAVCADGSPMWGLFGGWIEDGEVPVDAVVREVREELGCDLKSATLNLVGVEDRTIAGNEIECHVFAYPVEDELEGAELREGSSWAFRDPRALLGRLMPHHEEIASAYRPR